MLFLGTTKFGSQNLLDCVHRSRSSVLFGSLTSFFEGDGGIKAQLLFLKVVGRQMKCPEPFLMKVTEVLTIRLGAVSLTL